jgi:CRISPR-associated Csx11 family protein
MPNNAPLTQLSDHRDVLLACEAIGWLHMAGKAHPDFLRQHGGLGNGYEPKKWAKSLVPTWDTTLAWLRQSRSLPWPNSPTDFLSQFDQGKSKSSVVGLLQAAHAMASGIEKNHPSNTTKYLGQDTTHMWMTTAFGHPVRNLLEDPPEVLRDGGWEALIQDIAALLAKLMDLGEKRPAAQVSEWHDWRSGAIGPEGWLRRAFSQTLAETRIPNNDVTLWDQSYVAAALFKSAVAGAVLERNDFKRGDNLKQNTRWRVLTVGLGARHYEGRAVRIGDWTGARREIDRFFDEVCKLVEVELAAGSLLYRDDEILAFSFPGRPLGKPEGDLETLRSELQDQVDRLKWAKVLDTPPAVRLSGSTRSMIRMSREVEEAREQIRVPLHRSWKLPEKSGVRGGHTCPVCGLRPNGTFESVREKKGKPCEPCRERRRGRLQDWLAGQVEGDSIWISEVADRNDRVALLTLSLDITGWLSGDHVDSLRAQSVSEMLDTNQGLSGYLGGQPTDPVNDRLTKSIADYVTTQKKTAKGKLSDPLLSSFNDGFRHETDLGSFFDKMVQDRADAPSWNELDGHDQRRAQWLAHQLFRKNASPGRVRRFWETTEAFFSELLAQFREIASRDANRWRVRRCVVTAKSGNWEDNATYRGRSGAGDDAAPLELLYRQSEKRFITISNLARILDPAEDMGALRGKALDLMDDEGTRHALAIDQVVEAPAPLGTYHPLIVLDRSPTRFRLLVPLEVADACVQAAVEKWEAELARVWDRLALRVGVVGFPRKLPYQAVVEAARNVEDDLARSERETWRVDDVRTRDGVTALSVVRPEGEHQLIAVPTVLPDGRPDVFYPYCAVEDTGPRAPHDFVAPLRDSVHHRARQVFRWMPELRPGDGIRVAPSRVARVFLDSTARRFEPVLVRPLDDLRVTRETWRLVQDAAPSLTAARALEAILLEKQEVWSFPMDANTQASWLDFVRASLVNLWSVHGAALDTLVDAARRGILQETLAWHLHVLKQDTENEQ